MLKLVWETKATNYDFVDVNDNADTKLEIVMGEDFTIEEVIYQLIKILKMDWSNWAFTEDYWKGIVETLVANGTLTKAKKVEENVD